MNSLLSNQNNQIKETIDYINLRSITDNDYELLKDIALIDNKELIEGLREYYKYNLDKFIDHLCIMRDPNFRPQDRKYKLFQGQKTLTDWFQETAMPENPDSEVKVYEKSRRVGWTNTSLLCILWAAIFWQRSSIIATKDFDSVDTLYDPDNSLLPRLRLAINYLPHWLIDNYETKQGLIIINNATISGEATATPDSASKLGRSGRVRYVLFDEAGFWSSYNLELAFKACSATANYRILISSASDNNVHFFSRLADGVAIPTIKGEWIPHTVNPANNDNWLRGLIATNTKEFIDQEVFGKRGMLGAKVIERKTKMSIRDENDVLYTINHPFITKELKKTAGYYFISFDGGSMSKTKACIIGYHIEETGRDILIKEIINAVEDIDSKDLIPLTQDAKRFIDTFLTDRELKAYGDPVLGYGGEAEQIEDILKVKVNLLNSLKRTVFYKPARHLEGFFANRMEKRISCLKRDVDIKLSDNIPKIIILQPDKEHSLLTFGCPLLTDGIINGQYQWAMEKGQVVFPRKLNQNHPIVDVCDAYTYYILETRPTLAIAKSDEKIEKFRMFE